MIHSTARSGAGENLRRGVLAALVLPAMLALAACGTASIGSGAPNPAISSSPAPASASGGASPSSSLSASPSVAASPTADDPCSLVTAEEAAALVGSDVTPTMSDTPAGKSCQWVPSSADARGFLTLTVITADVDTALQDAIENFGLGEVTGVGSTAAGIDGTIYASTGTTGFAIVATDGTFQPVPLADLTTLAQTVVERLGGSSVAPPASPSGSATPSGSASPSPSAS